MAVTHIKLQVGTCYLTLLPALVEFSSPTMGVLQRDSGRCGKGELYVLTEARYEGCEQTHMDVSVTNTVGKVV